MSHHVTLQPATLVRTPNPRGAWSRQTQVDPTETHTNGRNRFETDLESSCPSVPLFVLEPVSDGFNTF